LIFQAQKVSNHSISLTESDNSGEIIEEVISDNDSDNITHRGAFAAPSISETEVVTVGGLADSVKNDVENLQLSGNELVMWKRRSAQNRELTGWKPGRKN
jgi:hypothetical protein